MTGVRKRILEGRRALIMDKLAAIEENEEDKKVG